MTGMASFHGSARLHHVTRMLIDGSLSRIVLPIHKTPCARELKMGREYISRRKLFRSRGKAVARG
jgi:hypothetical protein